MTSNKTTTKASSPEPMVRDKGIIPTRDDLRVKEGMTRRSSPITEGMIVKIITIRNCEECPHMFRNTYRIICTEAANIVINPKFIPSWCPLDNKKDFCIPKEQHIQELNECCSKWFDVCKKKDEEYEKLKDVITGKNMEIEELKKEHNKEIEKTIDVASKEGSKELDEVVKILIKKHEVELNKLKSQHDKQMKSVLSDSEREIAELKSEIRKLVADQNEIQLKTREGTVKELMECLTNHKFISILMDKRLFDAIKKHDEIIKSESISKSEIRKEIDELKKKGHSELTDLNKMIDNIITPHNEGEHKYTMTIQILEKLIASKGAAPQSSPERM